jgi:hypothetical protein
MKCGDFYPSLDRFCSNPKDFVNGAQLIQMAMFFGVRGPELKKIKLMAEAEEKILAYFLDRSSTVT